MTSNINTDDIDVEFPLAGQDNDSQGFRDNFSVILDNFESAKTEIQQLQDTAVRVNRDNTFTTNTGSSPALLINANLKSHTESFYAGGTIDGSVTISYINGEYQTYILNGDVTLNLDTTGWPVVGRYAKLTLQVSSIGAHTLSFASSINLKLDNQSTSWNGASIPVASTVDPEIIELWTYNNGNTVFARHLGRFE